MTRQEFAEKVFEALSYCSTSYRETLDSLRAEVKEGMLDQDVGRRGDASLLMLNLRDGSTVEIRVQKFP